MNMPGSAARAQTQDRALRPSNGSGEGVAVENARLGREIARLQAVCDQHERTLCGLTQAMWRLRQEPSTTESQLAQRDSGQHEEVEDPAEEISLLAERHRLGFRDARSHPIDPAGLAAWAIDAREGTP